MQFEKREMKMRLAGKAGRAAVFCLCAGLVLGDPMKGFAWEQTEHVRRITGSNALGRPLLMTESKDLWENWVGDLGFLDGTRGDGSREKPCSRYPQRHSSWAFPGLRPWKWRSKRGRERIRATIPGPALSLQGTSIWEGWNGSP